MIRNPSKSSIGKNGNITFRIVLESMQVLRAWLTLNTSESHTEVTSARVVSRFDVRYIP